VTLTASNAGGSDTETKAGYISVTFTEPVANFTANVTRGVAPLVVRFNDTTENSPTVWSWKFGDGGKSSEQNPVHTFTDPGSYTVSLSVENTAGKDSLKKSEYIEVNPLSSPVASFTASATSGKAPLVVRFNDTSANTPTSWLWAFGDGSTSPEQNPSHTYQEPGTYTVSLTATNAAGNSFKSITILADGIGQNTVQTTVPTTAATVAETTAAVTTVTTTAPASSTGSSTMTYIIGGIVAIVAIAGGIFYFRNRNDL
jgi:LPXTG-motif cell wall-anchored protein